MFLNKKLKWLQYTFIYFYHILPSHEHFRQPSLASLISGHPSSQEVGAAVEHTCNFSRRKTSNPCIRDIIYPPPFLFYRIILNSTRYINLPCHLILKLSFYIYFHILLQSKTWKNKNFKSDDTIFLSSKTTWKYIELEMNSSFLHLQPSKNCYIETWEFQNIKWKSSL